MQDTDTSKQTYTGSKHRNRQYIQRHMTVTYSKRTHTHIHTHTPAHAHTHSHAHPCSYAHTSKNTHGRALICANTCARAARMYTHTHAHTHRLQPSPSSAFISFVSFPIHKSSLHSMPLGGVTWNNKMSSRTHTDFDKPHRPRNPKIH